METENVPELQEEITNQYNALNDMYNLIRLSKDSVNLEKSKKNIGYRSINSDSQIIIKEMPIYNCINIKLNHTGFRSKKAEESMLKLGYKIHEKKKDKTTYYLPSKGPILPRFIALTNGGNQGFEYDFFLEDSEMEKFTIFREIAITSIENLLEELSTDYKK